MERPWAGNELRQLGKRLATGSASAEDWSLYDRVIAYYDGVTGRTRAVVSAIEWATVVGRDVRVDVTSRTKTRTTLLEKLRRTPGVGLGHVRDISGVRLVGDLTLREQDLVAAHLQSRMGDPASKVVDRRAEPLQGYRAVHVIVKVDGVYVEIQIRTRLQAAWADLFERLADAWGRGIRYGESMDVQALEAVPEPELRRRLDVVELVKELSLTMIAPYEKIESHLHQVLEERDEIRAALADMRIKNRRATSETLAKQTVLRRRLVLADRYVKEAEVSVPRLAQLLDEGFERLEALLRL